MSPTYHLHRTENSKSGKMRQQRNMFQTRNKTKPQNKNSEVYIGNLSSVQFSSATKSCPTLCKPMDYSISSFPDNHQLLELAQTHVHSVGDAIQPAHLLSSSSPPAFNLSQHQGLFQWVCSLYQVAQVLELQRQPFQWIFRVDFL